MLSRRWTGLLLVIWLLTLQPAAGDGPASNGLTVRNGWYVDEGKVVWGLAQHNGWWRAGQRPNITRNAPEEVGPNPTEIDMVADYQMKAST